MCWQKATLTVRVFALWHSPRNLEDARKLVRLIEPFGKAAAPAGDDRLVSGGIKVFADGSGAARTAWTWQDWYRDRDGTSTRAIAVIRPSMPS